MASTHVGRSRFAHVRPRSRTRSAALAALTAMALVVLVAPAAQAATSARADFDGDGRADLAVGAPRDSVTGHDRAGAVNVLYGTRDGLSARGAEQLTQRGSSLAGFPSDGDRLGASVAAGDIDGDGFADLAIGVPGEDVTGNRNGGVVNVVYGSAGGLTLAGNRFVDQDTPGILGKSEPWENFGHALALADVDDDGFADLAVGVRDESVSGSVAAGAVNVIHGSADGLSTGRNQLWHQDADGVRASTQRFDRFGFSIAFGDFDTDGFADLAAGVPGERIRGSAEAGAVNVLFGSEGGLAAGRDQLWSQGRPGVRGGPPERGDGFGRTLAAADFDGDGRDDLAAGVPFEDVGPVREAGAVAVLFGGGRGLRAAGSELWHQGSRGVVGPVEPGDRVGSALAAGDLSGNRRADLVVGVAAESVRGRGDAGAANVLYGGARGLRPGPGGIWHQGKRGVTGALERFDRFATALAIDDFDGDGIGDLAVGASGESIGRRRGREAGAVHAIYGSVRGLRRVGDQLWHQGSRGVPGAVGPDALGESIGHGAPGI